jgi:hypothetical protein
VSVLPRVREITDMTGARLSISVERHPAGALIILECPDVLGLPRAMLDCHGAELLTGYIMAARLAQPHGLDDETVQGSIFPARFSLAPGNPGALEIAQRDHAVPFAIAASFWDRLYAELCIVVAHGRKFDRGGRARVH